MAIDALKTHVLKGMHEARKQLQFIPNEDLNYTSFANWISKWHGTTLMQSNQLPGAVHSNAYPRLLSGHNDSPPAVFHDIRTKLVELLDTSIRGIDATQTIPDVLSENISRIANPKLASLLNEFRAIKDIAPSSAGITLRTILICIIHLRAVALHNEGKLASHTHMATNTDFNLAPLINDALNAHLFDKADEKFLKLFLPSSKAIFDNTAHSTLDTALVDKEHLATLVEPLNKLLTYVRV